MAKLGECFSVIRNGASIRQTDGAGGFPITRIETIADKTINREKFGYAGIYDLAQYRDYILQDGDILMSHINSEKHLGKVALYSKQDDEQIIHGMNLLMLRADTQKVIPEYAKYYFESQKFLRQIGRITKKSVNQASFTVTALKELEIPLASIIVQRDISEKLKKVDWLVSLRKQQLAKLDELVKARFVEMFGVVHDSVLYPYVPVKSFTSVVSGGTPNRNVSEFWNNGSIRWVKTTELQNNVICNTDEKITQAGLDNSSAKIIPPNTVLIAMYGQGKTRGMTGYTSIECATNQACACILPCEQFNQNYLWRYMILSYDKLRDMAKGGNQPNLNIGIIKNFPVLKPPIELQNDFAAFVERVDKQKQTVQQSLEKLELMKKALMQEYFG